MKRNVKEKRRAILTKLIVTVLILALLAACLYIIGKPLYNSDALNGDLQNMGVGNLMPEDLTSSKSDGDEYFENTLDIDLQSIYSSNAVLADLTTNQIIAEKKSERRIYPASMTKIMTAVLAIENTDSLYDTVTLPTNIFEDLYAQGASMAGFLPGESVTYMDLLYGILLPSGAECCLTFAENIAGSESAFVDMMNEKAEEIGMKKTHFCNSTGLHNKNHYTTVKDIAVLLGYALQNENFRAAFTASFYSVQPNEFHPEGFTFYSSMFINLDSPYVSGGEILGGKTGYTDEAGLCLASLAFVNGREYILVTAGADGDHTTEQYNILDALNVYNQVGNN